MEYIVNWLILGSKVPGRLFSDRPIDLRLWLLGAVHLGEWFWLAVKFIEQFQQIWDKKFPGILEIG